MLTRVFTSHRIFVVAVLSALFLISCKKDTCNDPTNPKCGNYVACDEKIGANADFTIYEKLDNVIVEADTLWCNTSILFWAKNKPGCSLKWKLRTQGYSVTATDSFLMILPYAPPVMPTAKMYTLTLIVTKDNGACKSLKSIDSLTKQFYLWPEEYEGNFAAPYHYLPIFGTYAGYKKSNPNQLQYVTLFDTIRIAPNLPCNGGVAGSIFQYNIIKNLAYNNFGTDNVSLACMGFFYRKGACALYFNKDPLYPTSSPCYGSNYAIGYQGIARLDLHNKKKITIDYQYRDTISYKWVSDYFTGIKVN